MDTVINQLNIIEQLREDLKNDKKDYNYFNEIIEEHREIAVNFSANLLNEQFARPHRSYIIATDFRNEEITLAPGFFAPDINPLQRKIEDGAKAYHHYQTGNVISTDYGIITKFNVCTLETVEEVLTTALFIISQNKRGAGPLHEKNVEKAHSVNCGYCRLLDGFVYNVRTVRTTIQGEYYIQKERMLSTYHEPMTHILMRL